MEIRLTREKEILIGLIVSTEYIKQIAPILQPNYLQASSSKTIATWCLDYYDQYKEAPKELIQDIYTQNKSTLPAEDAELIAKTLQHVNDVYTKKDKYNVPYMVDKAEYYIRERRLVLLQDALEHEIVGNRIEKAENLIMGYNKIAKQERKVSNLWQDKQTIHSIFNSESKDLFRMPGIVGELTGYFQRDNLYAYAGVAKRGKTRWLSLTATVASIQRCNVLMIELEMTKEEITNITLNNLVRKPDKEREIVLPYFGDDNTINYKTETMQGKTKEDYLSWQKKAGTIGAPIHTIVGNPNETTLEDLESQILALELYEGFQPDVCIFDYADIVHGQGYDQRDRTNNIWVGLKNWAKKYHCAVITATHMNGDALKKDADAFNVGEDKRKLNHVSGMYILNQSEEEKKSGIMRIKSTATRFSEYTSLDEAVVLYNFTCGRTYIDSRWKHDIPDYE